MSRAPIAAASTPAQTRVAILHALVENDWVLESEKPGEILARYSRSDWTMLVEIAYSNEVSTRYVSSTNLQYGTSENGTTEIHRGYNNRVLNLSKEIGKEIMVARASDSPPRVASPPPAEVVPDRAASRPIRRTCSTCGSSRDSVKSIADGREVCDQNREPDEEQPR